MIKKNHAPKVSTQWLIKLLLQKGISVKEVISMLSLPKNTRVSILYALPFPKYLQLLNWAAVQFKDENFGLTSAHNLRRDAFGIAYYMSFNAITLRELFKSLQRFDSLISQVLEITFIEEPIISKLEYRIILPSKHATKHDIDLSLKLFLQPFRDYIDPYWKPSRVNFNYSKPSDIARLVEEFGTEIYFEQATNSIIFNSDLLDTRINDADPKLLRVFQEGIEETKKKLLQRHDSLIPRVRHLIAISLSSGQSSSEHIALQLNMSRRSLVRHLTNQSTGFRLIKDDVIEEIAKKLLTETTSNISMISEILGFSETSAFDRTFKKLSGYSPSEYRQRAHSS